MKSILIHWLRSLDFTIDSYKYNERNCKNPENTNNMLKEFAKNSNQHFSEKTRHIATDFENRQIIIHESEIDMIIETNRIVFERTITKPNQNHIGG